MPSRNFHHIGVIYARRKRGWCDRCQATVKLSQRGLKCGGILKRPLDHTMVTKDLVSRTGSCLWCGPIRLSCRGGCSVGHHLNQVSVDHGLTLGQAEVMRSGKTCEICDQPAEAVDHDHVTGKIRGVLCHHCNRGIGLFEDNPDMLKAAAEYLIRKSEPS